MRWEFRVWGIGILGIEKGLGDEEFSSRERREKGFCGGFGGWGIDIMDAIAKEG